MTVKIHVLARPQFDGAYEDFLCSYLPEGEREWQETNGATAAERLVEFAGRVCYMSFGRLQAPGSNRDYIRRLIRNEHESVLEHAAWTVLISGVSRAFTHQLVRHRVGFSFSQLSQQYYDESEINFIMPAGVERIPEVAKIWHQAMEDSRQAYRKITALLSQSPPVIKPHRENTRATRSAARSVLPNASETVIVATINARALRHFLKIRGSVIGDAEMRSVAAALLETLRSEGPALFSDFSIEYPSDGLPLIIHHQIS
jgi:thymidylate synthase (FAD)